MRDAFQPFDRVRIFARKLGLRSAKEWTEWCASTDYRLDIPLRPPHHYRDQWQGWPDWLNYSVSPRLSFEEARAFVRRIGLRSFVEWKMWCKSASRPACIPSEPWLAYKGEYAGLPDFLGYPRKLWRGQMMPFESARDYVRRLGLQSCGEYRRWASTSDRPRNIAVSPAKTYSNSWADWSDWLGYASRKRLSFQAAREYVRRLGLGSWKEWGAWARSSERPRNIPRRPDQIYRSSWRGMPNWLGFTPEATLPFYEARKLVRSLGLRSCVEWRAWASSNERPRNIPSAPDKTYHDYWKGWRNWLGTGWLAFHAARKYA
jgi:hypothetical protein